MPDALNPVVEITIEEKKYHLKCTLRSMNLFRELHKVDIFHQGIDPIKLDDNQFGDLFWCCLVKEEREKVTREEIQELIDRKNYFDVAVAISAAIMMSFPREEKKDEPEAAEDKDKSPLAENPSAGSISGRRGGLLSIFKRKSSGN